MLNLGFFLKFFENRAPALKHVCHWSVSSEPRVQWRRQRSKGARSFRGHKILQPGHPNALFPEKKLTTFFSCRRLRFTVKIKQIKGSDMVTFLFSVHTITEAKQCTGLGRAEPGQWIFQPGHLTWRALVQRRHCRQTGTSHTGQKEEVTMSGKKL